MSGNLIEREPATLEAKGSSPVMARLGDLVSWYNFRTDERLIGTVIHVKLPRWTIGVFERGSVDICTPEGYVYTASNGSETILDTTNRQDWYEIAKAARLQHSRDFQPEMIPHWNADQEMYAKFQHFLFDWWVEEDGFRTYPKPWEEQ